MLQAQTAPRSLLKRALGLEAARDLPPWIKWLLVALAACLPLIAVKHGREIHERTSAFLAMREVRAADRFASEGRQAAALRVLVNAFEKRPREPVVVRALAKAVAETHPAQAKYLLEELIALGASGPEDAVIRAPVLARLGDLAGAEACLASDSSPAATRSRGEVALIVNQPEIAARFLEDAVTREPGDHRAAILLGQSLAQAQSVQQRNEGVDRLLCELASAHAARRFEDVHQCIMALARLKGDAHHRGPAVITALESLPSRFPSARVLRAILSPDSGALHAVLARLESEDLEDRIEAARVLQAQNMHEVVTEWLAPVQAAADPALLGLYLDSLMAQSQWEAAAKLATWGDALTPASKHLLKALVVLRNAGGARGQARQLLDRAMNAAAREGRWGTFLAIGRVALEFDQHAVAIEAFTRIMDAPFNSETPVNDFMLAARRMRWPAAKVLDLLRRRELVDRTHLDLQKQIAYCQLLLGREMESADLKVQGLVELLPGDAFVHFLAALAAYRRGDHFTQSLVLSNLPRRRWHHGEAAVIHHLLAATPGSAMHYAGKFDPSSPMLVEEQVLAGSADAPRLASRSL